VADEAITLMSVDSIPQISVGTAVLIIFVVCTGIVLARGMARVLIGTIVLGLSAWIAFLAWQKAPSLSFEWFGKSIGLITYGLPIAAFVFSFIVIRKIVRAVARPFGNPADAKPKRPRSLGGLAARLLLALVPTSLICLIAAVYIHHAGSVAEVRAFASGKIHEAAPSSAKWTHDLKDSIASMMPESWLRFLDPLADHKRITLAKAIAMRSENKLEPVIDPSTGNPIPRAIVVDDPDLQKLARDGKFGTLLRHPSLTKALEDPKVQSLIKDLQF
jgi:hypothetical protein